MSSLVPALRRQPLIRSSVPECGAASSGRKKKGTGGRLYFVTSVRRTQGARVSEGNQVLESPTPIATSKLGVLTRHCCACSCTPTVRLGGRKCTCRNSHRAGEAKGVAATAIDQNHPPSTRPLLLQATLNSHVSIPNERPSRNKRADNISQHATPRRSTPQAPWSRKDPVFIRLQRANST